MSDSLLQPISPSFFTQRSLLDVVGDSLGQALQLMMLGSVSQANRIIEHLYHHDALDLGFWWFHAASLHFGWAQSKQWPKCLSGPDSHKPPFIPRQGDLVETLQRFEELCQQLWDEDFRNKYPMYEMEDLNSAISMVNGQPDRGKGKLTKILRINQAVEIALILGEQPTAEDMLRRCIPYFSKRGLWMGGQDQEITQCRRAWSLLCDGFLARELHVSEEKIIKHADLFIQMLTARFRNGCHRPYNDNSTKELIHCLDDRWRQIMEVKPELLNLVGCDIPEVPNTFTHSGLKVQEIADIEKRLDTQLPPDFKEFLKLTNGIYHVVSGKINGLFPAASLMDWEKTPSYKRLELITYADEPACYMNYFDWPPIDRGLRVATTPIDGGPLLIEPQTVKKAIIEFDKKYEDAEVVMKRRMEREVKDLYGGLQELRGMQWMVHSPDCWRAHDRWERDRGVYG